MRDVAERGHHSRTFPDQEDTMASNELITITKRDLKKIADDIADRANNPKSLTKPAILNTLAANILGPKHDWSFIAKSDSNITSQRAKSVSVSNEETTSFPLTFRDDGTDDTLKACIKNYADEGINIEIENGFQVWVEFNEGMIKCHYHTPMSDTPITIRGSYDIHPEINAEPHFHNMYPQFEDLEQYSSGKIIGYQVVNRYDNAEHAINRPSYEILTLEQARTDLDHVYKNSEYDFYITPITDGMIEDPTFHSSKEIPVPLTLNDLPVIAYSKKSDGSYYVLIERSDHPMHPYIVASWNTNAGNTWHYGHYFENEKQARSSFSENLWVNLK